MPVLVAVALGTATAVLVMVRRDRRDFAVTLAGLVGVLASLVITLGVLGPLNAQIALWSADAVPPGWEQVRDRWQAANVIREVVVVAGFVLLLMAGLRPRQPR